LLPDGAVVPPPVALLLTVLPPPHAVTTNTKAATVALMRYRIVPPGIVEPFGHSATRRRSDGRGLRASRLTREVLSILTATSSKPTETVRRRAIEPSTPAAPCRAPRTTNPRRRRRTRRDARSRTSPSVRARSSGRPAPRR